MRKFFAIVTSLGLVAISKAQIIDEGTINGAGYTIIIPKDWNGTLMMYAHGYEETEAYSSEDGEEMWEQQDSEATEEQEDGEFHEIFTSRGYAVAASDYRSKGMITIATIERFPAEYQGALPLCGYLAPVYSAFQRSLDMLVTFDYFFGDNSGKLVTGDMVSLATLKEQVNNNTAMIERFTEHFQIKKEVLANVIYSRQAYFKETVGLQGGLPIGNLQTIYYGFGFKDDTLNKNVRRYKSNPDALEYLLSYNTPSRRISDPVIAMDTAYD